MKKEALNTTKEEKAKMPAKIKRLTGIVVSDKMDKTISVRIDRRLSHPIYGKTFIKSNKILAHDEKNEFLRGDVVEIASCRPVSKKKAWQVVKKVAKQLDGSGK